MNRTRLEKLTASLRTSNLDAVILNPGPTLKHLSGMNFHLMERPVVLFVAPGRDPVLVLPELELPKVNLFPFKVQESPTAKIPPNGTTLSERRRRLSVWTGSASASNRDNCVCWNSVTSGRALPKRISPMRAMCWLNCVCGRIRMRRRRCAGRCKSPRMRWRRRFQESGSG